MTGQIADKQPVQAKTYVCFILDKSGSMASIQEEARTTFNEQIQVIREKAEDQEVVACVTLFNNVVGHPIWMQGIDKCKELTPDEYQPGGGTAMFDAIGFTVDKLKAECDDLDEDRVSVLFIVVSDGYENSSKEYGTYSDPTIIQNKIKEHQDTGFWTFTFLAANVNIMDLAQRMGVAVGNTRSFTSNKLGMVAARSAVTGALGNYFGSRGRYSAEVASTGAASAESMRSVDFYSSLDEDDSSEEKEEEKK